MLQTESAFSNILKNKYFVLLASLAAALAMGLTGVLDPIILLGVVAATYLVMLLFRWPDLSVILVVFVIYTNTAVVLTRFHDVPAGVGYALPMLLVIPFIWQIVVRNEKIRVNVILVFMIIYFSVMLLASAFSSDINLALPKTLSFVTEGLVLYFLFINTIRTPRLLNQVVWTMLAAGALLGGLSLYQQLTGTFDNQYWGFAQMHGVGFTAVETLQGDVRQFRAEGPIGEKNFYAQMMLMLVPLGLFRAWGEPLRRLRLLALLLTGLIFIGAALTFSRGAMVGFLLLILVMTLMRYIRVRQVLVILLGVVLLFAAFPQSNVRFSSMAAVFSSAEEGGLRSADASILGRTTEMLVALYVFLDHPVFGVGAGMIGYEMEEYSRLIGLKNIIATREAHNLYLGEAAETGALGFTALMIIFFYTLHRLATARKYWLERNQHNLANMCTGFFLAIISYMTTGLFLHMSYLRYIWLIMALAAVASEFRAAEAAERSAAENSEEAPLPATSLP